jgi:O-acetyl-ADP-ribose deacetylase (regulator of RNase III)
LLHGCETGQAKITPAFLLPAKWVIHTVGPVYQNGTENEADLLAQCYTSSLRLALAYNCKSVAFPSISTGIYGYPKQPAAKVAVNAVRNFLNKHELSVKVIFVCFDTENLHIYRKLLIE